MNLKENKMAYDPRAVKISKEVKRFAATYTSAERRREIFKAATRVEEAAMRTKSRGNRGDRGE
jgi:hypothetical protein